MRYFMAIWALIILTSSALAQTEGNSKLIVTSNVIGAAIVLNGQESEFKTPAYIPNLDEGAYIIELVDAYGKRISSEFSLEANKVKTVKLNFNLCRLEINSNLEADSVYVNDILVDTAIMADAPGLVEKLTKGDYTIKIIDKIYGIPIYDKFFLQADVNSVDIDAQLGELTIRSNFENARISLNGRSANRTTPTTLSNLAAGVYDILLAKDGKYARQTITLKPTSENKVNIEFEKSNLWKYLSAGAGLVGASTLTYLLTRKEANENETPIGSMPNPPDDN